MLRTVTLVILIAACKKSEDTGAATAPVGGTASAAAGSGSAASGSGGSAVGSGAAATETVTEKKKPWPTIDCNKHIPQEIADKYFKDVKRSVAEPVLGASGETVMATCRFVYDEKTNTKILVTYNCGPEHANLDEKLALMQKHVAAKFERVPGVGRGGYRMSEKTGMAAVIGAQHRSFPCIIEVDLAYLDDADPLRKKDWMPLVRELEAALPDTAE